MKKTQELRKLTDEQLHENILKLKEELFNLRLKNAVGQLENPSMVKKAKKQIARMFTILSERKLEERD